MVISGWVSGNLLPHIKKWIIDMNAEGSIKSTKIHDLYLYETILIYTNINGVLYRCIQILVGGLEHLDYFPIQLGMSSPQLTNSIIFQWGWLNHQPDINNHTPYLLMINHILSHIYIYISHALSIWCMVIFIYFPYKIFHPYIIPL